MTEFESAAAAFCAIATLLHVASCLLAIQRCRVGRQAKSQDFGSPAISILRPVRGLEPFDEATLRSGFELSYPNYELIMCCAEPDDPAVAVVKGLMAAHPAVNARLLIGDERHTANPKLNNLFKGWRAARHDWIVLADCNVLMPTDYLERLLAGWRNDAGAVCSPPVGCAVDGFWAEVECGFLNTYQARWQYAADTVGLGFAQGKTMMWRRADLKQAGGLGALGAEIAEDAAATKVVRGLGLRVRLVDRPFGQPLGRRTLRQVWDRQVRWARLRRATFPACFLPEILSGSILPLAAGAYGAVMVGLPPEHVIAGLGLIWFGSEALLARAAGWNLTMLSPAAWVLRDVILPVLWVNAWLGDSFSWRGNDMRLADAAVGIDR